MALITLPTSPGIRRIGWSHDVPTQYNRSGWTGRGQAVALPGAAIWRAQVEIPPITTEVTARTWRAFFSTLKGRENNFKLIAVESAQHSHGFDPKVSGGGQTGYFLALNTMPANVTHLKAGMFITVTYTNGDQQLMCLAEDLATDSLGQGTAIFTTPMRSSPNDTDTVFAYFPYAMMMLADDAWGWSVDPGLIYGFSFACEEVIV